MDEKAYVIFIAKKLHPEIVFNMGSQEGNPYTFVDVQTLLEGVTIGGHKLTDQDQILRISSGWKQLIVSVENDEFSLTKAFALEIHKTVARNEALVWGVFRDRQVLISGTDYKPPLAAELDKKFETMLARADKETNPEIRAMGIFLDCAKNQYFYDANKRTGQLLMNGVLLSNGKPPISIPAKLNREYNEHMLRFYDTGNEQEMRDFLNNCQSLITEAVKHVPG